MNTPISERSESLAPTSAERCRDTLQGTQGHRETLHYQPLILPLRITTEKSWLRGTTEALLTDGKGCIAARRGELASEEDAESSFRSLNLQRENMTEALRSLEEHVRLGASQKNARARIARAFLLKRLPLALVGASLLPLLPSLAQWAVALLAGIIIMVEAQMLGSSYGEEPGLDKVALGVVGVAFTGLFLTFFIAVLSGAPERSDWITAWWPFFRSLLTGSGILALFHAIQSGSKHHWELRTSQVEGRISAPCRLVSFLASPTGASSSELCLGIEDGAGRIVRRLSAHWDAEQGTLPDDAYTLMVQWGERALIEATEHSGLGEEDASARIQALEAGLQSMER